MNIINSVIKYLTISALDYWMLQLPGTFAYLPKCMKGERFTVILKKNSNNLKSEQLWKYLYTNQ